MKTIILSAALLIIILERVQRTSNYELHQVLYNDIQTLTKNTMITSTASLCLYSPVQPQPAVCVQLLAVLVAVNDGRFWPAVVGCSCGKRGLKPAFISQLPSPSSCEGSASCAYADFVSVLHDAGPSMTTHAHSDIHVQYASRRFNNCALVFSLI